MGRKHKLDEVLKELSRKNDVRVSGTVVMVLSDKIVDKKCNIIDNPQKRNDLGNGSWGRIDYLVNHCGYGIVKVEQFIK